jgi:lipoprotein-anchoring transpeptidase ErfK/SrfK
MRPTILAATLAATLAALTLASPGARAEVLVVVDKSTQRMTVTVDGAERHAWPVSTGTADYATPAGSFTPLRLARTHFSREWDDAPMPHSIFFTERGHAIHGSGAVGRLGSPASHGCVRLAPGPAGVLFRLVAAQARGRSASR